MAKDFLPDYGSLSINGMYRPMFRLFANERWRTVRAKGKPVMCATASEAMIAAKAHVQNLLNPPVRSCVAEMVSEVLDVDRWRREKAAEDAEERMRLAGGIIKNGKIIPVEHVRKRA